MATYVKVKRINAEGITGRVEMMNSEMIRVLNAANNETIDLKYADEDQEDGSIEEVEFIHDQDAIVEIQHDISFLHKKRILRELGDQVHHALSTLINNHYVPQSMQELWDELEDEVNRDR
jgi:hypothetical protein